MKTRNLISVLLGLLVTYAANSMAGAYIFSGETYGVDLITHPSGYSGTGGELEVTVGINPGSPYASDMVNPVKNAIAYFNKGTPTTRNLRDNFISGVDFESVMIHELGHCIGMAHVNAATESGLSGNNQNYTKATNGANNVFNVNSGSDSVIGSADDIRGDDVNLHWYRKNINNPFSIAAIVDGSTYARETVFLPDGDTFVANAERSVSSLYKAPNTEALMQQGSYFSEIQRSPTHSDIATLKLGMSGKDETASTSDDYIIKLVYAGLTTSADVIMKFDNAETGFAVCKTAGEFIGTDHAVITSANIYFNTGYSWSFNSAPSCRSSFSPSADKWHQISVPCELGISTSAKMKDVFGDDLDLSEYNATWVIYHFNFSQQNYRTVQPDDELINGEGYWFITTDSGITVDVEGEYPAQIDVPLAGDATKNWSMIGNPFRYPAVWADTKVIAENGDVLDLTEADPVDSEGKTSCAQSLSDCLALSSAYHFDHASERYVLLSPTSGSLPAWGAAWVYAKNNNIAMRITMPAQEANTP